MSLLPSLASFSMEGRNISRVDFFLFFTELIATEMATDMDITKDISVINPNDMESIEEVEKGGTMIMEEMMVPTGEELGLAPKEMRDSGPFEGEMMKKE